MFFSLPRSLWRSGTCKSYRWRWSSRTAWVPMAGGIISPGEIVLRCLGHLTELSADRGPLCGALRGQRDKGNAIAWIKCQWSCNSLSAPLQSHSQVFLGGHNITKDYAVSRRVKVIQAHERFDIFSFNNDIALLKMDRPVEFGPKIQPICLPDGCK